MLKKGLLLLTAILLIFALAGCSVSEDTTTKTSTEVEVDNVYPLTINDGTGSEVTLQEKPTRIVSLIPSLTETLFAIGAGDNVVGVTIHDNYPENVKDQVEYVFEDALNPNIEQIINLNPDLVVLGAFNDELTGKIRDLNIPVAKFDPQNIEEVYTSIEALGKLTNNMENANNLILEMKTKEEEIINKTSDLSEEDKVRVWVEISSDLWTTGKGTFIDELITKAGGINIVDEPGWLQYSEEKVIEKNPQIIITTYGKYDPNAVNNVITREGWNNVEALQNNRVLNIDDDLVTRPGPRIIDGLEEIAKVLYPDLFK